VGRDRMWVLTDVAPYHDGPAGVHGVLPQAARALCEIGTLAGLDPEHADGVDGLAPNEIENGGLLALFTIGETAFSQEQRGAIAGAWRSGRLGVLGVHAATDACHGWTEYGEILGGRFDGHPWTQDFAVQVVDADHPSTAELPRPWPWHDEVYLFKDLDPQARVLLTLDPAQLDMSVPDARVPACGFPLAWSLERGNGRTFYTALGHFPHAWETPTYLRHLAGGLSWLREGVR
jgi:uncharacterized protein